MMTWKDYARWLFAIFVMTLLAKTCHAQASPFSISTFKAQTFTATGQTGTPIQLNGLTVPSTVGSSFSSGCVDLTGTGLSSVTFSVLGSTTGVNYYALPSGKVGSTAVAANSQTATAPGVYCFSLAGLAYVRFGTTGTFTATAIALTLTASPQASIVPNVESGGGGGGNINSINGDTTSAQTLVAAGLLTVVDNGDGTHTFTGLVPNSTQLATAGTLSNDTTGSASKVGGVTISGTPTAGQAPVATDGTHATWQTVSSGATCAGTPRGVWSAGTAYNCGDIVQDVSGNTYQAQVDVPAGTLLSNTTYYAQIGLANPIAPSSAPFQIPMYQGNNVENLIPSNLQVNSVDGSTIISPGGISTGNVAAPVGQPCAAKDGTIFFGIDRPANCQEVSGQATWVAGIPGVGGGSGGIQSINGDTTSAQTMTGAGTVTVSTTAGHTTITGSGGTGTTYTGLVGTRGLIPDGEVTSFSGFNGRTRHVIKMAMLANTLHVQYPTWTVNLGNNQEGTVLTTGTAKVSIEYPFENGCQGTSQGNLNFVDVAGCSAPPVVGQSWFNANDTGTAETWPQNTVVSSVTSGGPGFWHVVLSQNANITLASTNLTASTITQCTFSGATSTTPAGPAPIDALCPIAVPENTPVYFRLFLTGGSTAAYTFPSNNYRTVDLTVDQFSNTPIGSTPVDLTSGGSVASVSSNGLYPIAIYGPTSNPAMCLFGDSRDIGYGDHPTEVNGYNGELERIIGPVEAFTNFGGFGTTVGSIVADPTIFTNRLAVSRYCSIATNAYGINDLNVVGATDNSALVATNRAAFNGITGLPTIGVTLDPETTSTDSFATTANQTITKNTSAINALIRHPGIGGEIGVIDTNAVLDPYQQNVWQVAPAPGQTTGTAFYFTGDGVHGNATAYNTLAQHITYVPDALPVVTNQGISYTFPTNSSGLPSFCNSSTANTLACTNFLASAQITAPSGTQGNPSIVLGAANSGVGLNGVSTTELDINVGHAAVAGFTSLGLSTEGYGVFGDSQQLPHGMMLGHSLGCYAWTTNVTAPDAQICSTAPGTISFDSITRGDHGAAVLGATFNGVQLTTAGGGGDFLNDAGHYVAIAVPVIPTTNNILIGQDGSGVINPRDSGIDPSTLATNASVTAAIAAAKTVVAFTNLSFTPTALTASCQMIPLAGVTVLQGKSGTVATTDGSSWYPFTLNIRVPAANSVIVEVCGTGTPTFTSLSGTVQQ